MRRNIILSSIVFIATINVCSWLSAETSTTRFGSVFNSSDVEPPFPFSEQASDNATDLFTDDVPIPPDTLAGAAALDDADGYVPNIFRQPAPKPKPVLRPRYQGEQQASVLEKNTISAQKQQKPGLSKPFEKTAALIRQANGSDEMVDKSEEDPIPSPTEKPKTDEESSEKRVVKNSDHYEEQNVKTVDEEALKKPKKIVESNSTPNVLQNNLSNDFQSNYGQNYLSVPEHTTINNEHSCDEFGCGAGCSPVSSWQYRHLSKNRPVRGLCDCCGLVTCNRKYRYPWFVDGWVSVGSFMNTHWPDNKDNRPLNFNDRNGDVVMNQLYLSFGRKVNTRQNRWDIGGQVDLLYGTDYFFTSSLGLETKRTYYASYDGSLQTMDPSEALLHWNSNDGKRRNGSAAVYGLSLPQAYAEVFAPIGNGITVKAGHFYADMGLESTMSPHNFFYSHSYSFMYGSPVTLTGLTASTKLGRRLTVTAGFSQGWDVWDSPTGKLNGLFGMRWDSHDKRSSLSFMLHTGENSLRSGDNQTSYTLTYQRRFGSRWTYALEHTYGEEENGALLDIGLFDEQRGRARWASIAQYLTWQCSETFALGFRAEWFHDSGHSRIQKGIVNDFFAPLSGQNYYELTLGANWKPTRYLTIRPEVRYDWSNVQYGKTGGVYSANDRREMVSFAIDAVFRF